MSLIRKFRRALRGDVDVETLLRELKRRRQSARLRREEHTRLDQLNRELPKLKKDLSAAEWVSYFRSRTEPHFFRGFDDELSTTQRETYARENESLLLTAQVIVEQHKWPLLGLGLRDFGAEIEWRRDLLSQHLWPLDYHCDIELIRNDGSDARVLWELNRLGHLLTLSCAFQMTRDEVFSRECLDQLESWIEQNPYGRGINWTCAMEAALRSINLLAVFHALRHSSCFETETLQLFLRLFHQHGTYITYNLEYSHIATSNHYLSDVVGLLWLGVMLPEFQESEKWRSFGLTEMLREMDKQVLPDGADFESSTGYHRFVLELLIYSFILCKENRIEIEPRYWNKLNSMLQFTRGYLRPDGLAPLIGDSDSGRALPMSNRSANDHAYVLAVGAELFDDASLQPTTHGAPAELFWLLGAAAFANYGRLQPGDSGTSQAFEHAGVYVLRKDDLYLAFITSNAGLNGRGSHGHNDALSIEVCAGGRAFIVDPGTYVYTADLSERHLFRSTAYHSTVRVDSEEQNTTLQSVPFVIGNEAKPTVLKWETGEEMDCVVAEHYGYRRLAQPITHRRTVWFYKHERYWIIEDEFFGDGEHEGEVRFHFSPGLEVRGEEGMAIAVCHKTQSALSVILLDLKTRPELENQATSSDYGEKQTSVTACWRVSGKLEKLRWRIQLSDML